MTFKEKACSTCATPFVPTSSRAKYCQPCGKEAQHEENRDYYSRNRERLLDRNRRRYADNPALKMFRDARRPSRRYSAFDDLTLAELEAYVDQHDGHCDLCGVEFEGVGKAPRARTLEHLHAFKDGGANTAANIALTCWTYNRAKAHAERRAAIIRSRTQRAA